MRVIINPSDLISRIIIATEEFDHLCFEYGLEMDEDVRVYVQGKYDTRFDLLR